MVPSCPTTCPTETAGFEALMVLGGADLKRLRDVGKMPRKRCTNSSVFLPVNRLRLMFQAALPNGVSREGILP